MNHRKLSPANRPVRHDGWTPERRERFLELLAAGTNVRWACRGVGLSQTAAYNLRRRDPEFARDWQTALRTARLCTEDTFIAMLPERLRRKMTQLSGECQLGGAEVKSQDTVSLFNQA